MKWYDIDSLSAMIDSTDFLSYPYSSHYGGKSAPSNLLKLIRFNHLEISFPERIVTWDFIYHVEEANKKKPCGQAEIDKDAHQVGTVFGSQRCDCSAPLPAPLTFPLELIVFAPSQPKIADIY